MRARQGPSRRRSADNLATEGASSRREACANPLWTDGRRREIVRDISRRRFAPLIPDMDVSLMKTLRAILTLGLLLLAAWAVQAPADTTTQCGGITFDDPAAKGPGAQPGVGISTAATDGDDVIFGTNGNNTIDGKGGDDIICGFGGDDTLNGGTNGDDTLNGGTGNDKLTGGVGDDTLNGDDGNDTPNRHHRGPPPSRGAGGDQTARGARADPPVRRGRRGTPT